MEQVDPCNELCTVLQWEQSSVRQAQHHEKLVQYSDRMLVCAGTEAVANRDGTRTSADFQTCSCADIPRDAP